MINKEYITIFDPALARDLLKNGYIIHDIKPHRDIKNATIFIFKNSRGLVEIVRKHNADKKGRC